MKRLILRFSALALLLLPGIVAGIQIDPVMVTLDNPNQVVTAPSSGITMVTFTGTVFVDQNYRMDTASFDFPFNSSQTNDLVGTFDSGFLTFFGQGNGTYTGALFELDVPAGTPPDLYQFQFASSNPAQLFVHANLIGEGTFGINSINGELGASDSATFSVQVNAPANGVPDRGSSMLLLGVSLASIIALRQRLLFT